MKKIISTLIILLLSLPINAESSTKKIDNILNNLFEQDGPGGVALVVKEGKTIYRKAFGMANLELGVKMTPDFIFRVGSVTKQFTAAAIIQLAEQGKIDLTADITEYLKDFPTQNQEVTIEHLLTHTSGIMIDTTTNDLDLHKKMQDLNSSELVDLIKGQSFKMVPGEKYEYSNANYILLGRIIEIVSGQSYPQYLQENIFKPLEMNNTSYDSPKRIIKNRAHGYAKNSEDSEGSEDYENADYISMTQPFAAGAIVSTVDDLAQWQQGLYNYQIMSKESLAKASIPFVLNNGDTAGFGYNWGYNGYNIQGIPNVKYNGSISGFFAATNYLPSEKVYVAILSNCRCNSVDKIINKITALAIDKPYEWEEIKLNNEQLESFEGVYSSESLGDRYVVFENNSLKTFEPFGKKILIYPFKQNQFFFKELDHSTKTISFNTDSDTPTLKMTSPARDEIWTKSEKKVPKLKSIKLDISTLESYVGRYELSPDFYIDFILEGDSIYFQEKGKPKGEQIAISETQFASVDYDISATINHNEDGKVESLTFHFYGDHLAKRIE